MLQKKQTHFEVFILKGSGPKSIIITKKERKVKISQYQDNTELHKEENGQKVNGEYRLQMRLDSLW